MEPCSRYPFMLEEIYSTSENNGFDGQIQFINEVAFKEVTVNLRATQQGDGSIGFENRFDGCGSSGIIKKQIAAPPLGVMHGACKDDAIPFRQRFFGSFVGVVADHEDVALIQHRLEERLILGTGPIGKVGGVPGDLAIDGYSGNCDNIRFDWNAPQSRVQQQTILSWRDEIVEFSGKP